MRGIPAFIQTREDLQNLFALAQQGAIDKAELAERARTLLSTQYHSVPILNKDGVLVTTRYFPEVSTGDKTAEGLTVKGVAHKESTDPDISEGYTETEITLSKTPAGDMEAISIFKEQNPLTANEFDIAEINYILGVLDNA